MLKKWRLVSALVLFSAASSATAQNLTALTGATVLDGKGGAIENGVIIISDHHISCVGNTNECKVPSGVTQFNLSKHFITPGLVDSHVHFAQTGWIDGRPDGVEAPDVYPYDETVAQLRANPDRWHKSYLCSGITAAYDVGGADWTITDSHATDTDRSDRVHVRAAGPLITYASARNRFFQRGEASQAMFLPMDKDKEVRANVAHLKKIGAAAVKVWFLKPTAEREKELDNRLMLVGELARKAGLPLIVHSTGLREAKVALRAGAKMLVHSIEDKLVDQEFIDLLLKNDAVYAPTLVVGSNWTRAMAAVAIGKPIGVDDPNDCVDNAIMDRIIHPERLTLALGGRISASRAMELLEEAERTPSVMYANLRTVYAAGAHVVTATDAGNPLTLHGPSIYSEMEAMQEAGLTPRQIITAATLKGAEAMGIASKTGSLEVGKLADLIVMTKDPREDIANFRSLSHVMRKGIIKKQSDLKVR
jgi:imidazolonepropionase-like amidohydrolase